MNKIVRAEGTDIETNVLTACLRTCGSRHRVYSHRTVVGIDVLGCHDPDEI